jgi:hypothetical protein
MITPLEVANRRRIARNLRMPALTAAPMPWCGYIASQFAPGSDPAPLLVLSALTFLSGLPLGLWLVALVRYRLARRALAAMQAAADQGTTPLRLVKPGTPETAPSLTADDLTPDDAALARALKGAKIADTTTFTLPSGRTLTGAEMRQLVPGSRKP